MVNNYGVQSRSQWWAIGDDRLISMRGKSTRGRTTAMPLARRARRTLPSERNLPGRNSMTDIRKSNVSRRTLLAGSAATATLLAAPAIVRAQGGPLKVGVLLPRSGAQASIGQDCYRGVEVAPAIFKDLGLPAMQIMRADTWTNIEVERARAEKLIADGAQLLVGAFDSGQTTAIAQVAEQKGIPLVINIAAAPPITEQGYKFVFRNFPTA